MSRKQLSAVATSVTVVLCMFMTEVAYAADADYGKRAGEYVSSQLQAIWVAVVSCGALAFLFPGVRKPAILFGFLAAVLLTGLVVFAPEMVEDMIKGIGKRIKG